jgi:hypothetical protein
MQMRRIVAVMYDGTKHEATGVHAGLADRVAYEKHFGETTMARRTAVLRQIDEDGELKEEADGSAFSEAKIAFFPWCILRREIPDIGDFEEFLAGCEELIIEPITDPTAPTLPSDS